MAAAGGMVAITATKWWCKVRLILRLHPANKRQCYVVTKSLVGWAPTQNQPCKVRRTPWLWLSSVTTWRVGKTQEYNHGWVLQYYYIQEEGRKHHSNNNHRSCDKWLQFIQCQYVHTTDTLWLRVVLRSQADHIWAGPGNFGDFPSARSILCLWFMKYDCRTATSFA